MRYILSFFLACIALTSFGSTVTINAAAPAYVGKTVEILEIEDYFTMKERVIARAEVLADSTFSVTFTLNRTQKIVIKSNNNSSFLYVQPNATYDIFFPERNKFEPYKPTGNSVELSFYGLDSTDINYKILGFQRWIDHFIGNNYHLKSLDEAKFSENFDRFKSRVEKAYSEDTTEFFKTYVRFTFAGLDNIEHMAARNRYEKHDFYIKHSPVSYENDAYMEYIKGFYQELIPRLPNQTNEKVYRGVLKSSPTAIMRALRTEYTLINMRIRELVMINSLAEVYNSGRYPETNIITVLDSVSTNGMFEGNRVIAKNLIDRLTDLVPGGQAPDFVLAQPEKKTKTLLNFQGKYVYLHFLDPNSNESMRELQLLKDIHGRYSEYVSFVSIYKPIEDTTGISKNLNEVSDLPWDTYAIPTGNSIWKKYRVSAYPHYVLIDATGHIVSSPALGPSPNGQYETIDKTFFYLKKEIEYKEENPEYVPGN